MKYTKRTGIALLWIAIWFALARVINKPLVLVGPEMVLSALIRMVPTWQFWSTIGNSFLRIGGGFLGGLLVGGALGALAYCFSWLEDLLLPFISLMKAVPVASFVILALMAMGSKNLAVLIVWIMVIPIVYHNTLQGFKNANRELLEVAKVFHMSLPRRFIAIYRPALRPFLISAVQTGIGMSWKSGVAAEVIGVSGGSIGEQLYTSKIYLETADLFAWTLVIILLSVITEKVMTCILNRLLRSTGERRGRG